MNFKQPTKWVMVQPTASHMANIHERLSANSTGRFYVDGSCIDCDFCRSTAPEFFSRNYELGFSIVHRQPLTPQEVELAEEALSECPTIEIGSDGPGSTD